MMTDRYDQAWPEERLREIRTEKKKLDGVLN
jgi:hypothetical protein